MRRREQGMASYVLDEFLGAGLLKNMGRIFAADGWDDVPTLKVISAEDMEALDLTDTQRVSASVIAFRFALSKHSSLDFLALYFPLKVSCRWERESFTDPARFSC